jgi:hypothetical protein
MNKFYAGDIVEAFGVKGRVYDVDEYIHVAFQNNEFSEFLLDGRSSDWHLAPSLVLVDRPGNRKVKKLYIAVKNKTAHHSDTHETSWAYPTKRGAEGMWSAEHHVVEIEIITEE